MIPVLDTLVTVMHLTPPGMGSKQDAVVNSKPDVTSSVPCSVLTAPDLSHPPAVVTASRIIAAESSMSGTFVLS